MTTSLLLCLVLLVLMMDGKLFFGNCKEKKGFVLARSGVKVDIHAFVCR